MWLISRGFKSHSVIGYSSKNLMEIQGVEKKNTGKFQGVVKVLMEFQGVQFLKMDILNNGLFLENFIYRYKMSLGKHACSKLSEACQRSIRVIYTDSPPPIFADDSGNIKGVLKGRIDFQLSTQTPCNIKIVCFFK